MKKTIVLLVFLFGVFASLNTLQAQENLSEQVWKSDQTIRWDGKKVEIISQEESTVNSTIETIETANIESNVIPADEQRRLQRKRRRAEVVDEVLCVSLDIIATGVFEILLCW